MTVAPSPGNAARTAHISGVLVHARPEHAPAVRRRILEVPGATVHAASGDGRLIVTLEREGNDDMAAAFRQLADIPGVLSSALVYHYCDPDGAQET